MSDQYGEDAWRDEEDLPEDQEPRWPICVECQSDQSFEFHYMKADRILCDLCYNKLIKNPGYHSCTKSQ